MGDFDAIVVGAGVIGLSIANGLAADGVRVALMDPHPGSGASGVAAGMLAPVAEAAYGEEDLAELAIRSSEQWPQFAESIEERSGGFSVGFRQDGGLLVAADASDDAILRDLISFQRELGLAVERLTPSDARRLEPLLSPSLRGAIYSKSEAQVDSRKVLAGLGLGARRLGVTLIRERATEVLSAGGSVTGVLSASGETSARIVVVAAGYESGLIGGVPDSCRPPVRPLKGQLLRLRRRVGSPQMGLTVRGMVAGASVYVVSRGDGQVVVGATVEDLGEDRSILAGSIHGLLRDAMRVLPFVGELELTEISAGLRPGSFDNAAIVGPGDLAGLVYACGHYRNGYLYAPLTQHLVRGLVRGGDMPDWARPLSPRRGVASRESP